MSEVIKNPSNERGVDRRSAMQQVLYAGLVATGVYAALGAYGSLVEGIDSKYVAGAANDRVESCLSGAETVGQSTFTINLDTPQNDKVAKDCTDYRLAAFGKRLEIEGDPFYVVNAKALRAYQLQLHQRERFEWGRHPFNGIIIGTGINVVGALNTAVKATRIRLARLSARKVYSPVTDSVN